jgi:hypothetical protein
MGTVKMDATTVKALAERVLDGADRLDEIRWPTVASDALAGSTVGSAIADPAAEERLADVVAHLRTWATAVRAAVAALERAEVRHANRLGEPR